MSAATIVRVTLTTAAALAGPKRQTPGHRRPPIVIKGCRDAILSVRAATKRVLIVDDQPIVVGVLRAFFAQFQHGHTYELTTASSANDAFIRLLQEQFDLILLDIVLPMIDYWHVQQAAGLDLLKRVRDLGVTAPVLMMTGGDGGTPREVEALIEGAFGYLHKPFVWSELDHLVTLALGPRAASS